MQERDLEKLLFRHPYLLGAEFDDVKPRSMKRQVVRGKNRLDLLFDLESGLCIVELKKTRLIPNDVEQLLRYCESFNESNKLNERHYLIGKSPINAAKFESAIESSKFEIKPLYLGEHLPIQLVLDSQTRRYRALKDGEIVEDVIELRF